MIKRNKSKNEIEISFEIAIPFWVRVLAVAIAGVVLLAALGWLIASIEEGLATWAS